MTDRRDVRDDANGDAAAGGGVDAAATAAAAEAAAAAEVAALLSACTCAGVVRAAGELAWGLRRWR